jgi:hypothetical protein
MVKDLPVDDRPIPRASPPSRGTISTTPDIDTNAHSERKAFCATLNDEKQSGKMIFTAKEQKNRQKAIPAALTKRSTL